MIMIMKSPLIYIFCALLLVLSACERPYTPKPAGYPRINFPPKEYKTFQGDCPFSFIYPAYGKVSRDSTKGAEPCWYNIQMPQFNATIYLSYKPVASFKDFYEMADDARTFAYKHSVKAEDIVDSPYHLPNHISGMFYNIQGNTASAIQFFATDSNKHYLRMAMYFNNRPNKDSIAPVLNYIKQDVDTMLKSIKWGYPASSGRKEN